MKTETVEREEETRLRIIRFMVNNGGMASPTEIKKSLNLRDLPAVRYHIRNLISHGMVYEEESNGRAKSYRVQPFLMNDLIDQYMPSFRKFLKLALNDSIMCDAIGLEKENCSACTPEMRYEAIYKTIPKLIEYLIHFREDVFEAFPKEE